MGLDWVELIMKIEDEFGIEILNRQVRELRTGGLLAESVAKHVREKSSASDCPIDVEVADRVRVVLTRQLGASIDELDDDGNFVQDLRCG
ncbi:MAG: hypothetical protein ACUVXJ_14910 [Phycisphaerae bacterium]